MHYPNPLRQVPQISELLVRSAHAQVTQLNEGASDSKAGKIHILEKAAVAPKFGDSVWRALGVNVSPASYTYVVGTTQDRQKAVDTANRINTLAALRGAKYPLQARVVQPEGLRDYYVTIGGLGEPKDVAVAAKAARDIALEELQASLSEETKKDAALILKGQVVDATAMFWNPMRGREGFKRQ